MNFALWLEKKDIELYESILNEMERRQFLQAGLAGLAGLAGSKAEAAPPKEEPSRKKEITIKPMTVSLQDDSPKGKFSITIENAKGKKTTSIQFLIKKQIKEFLYARDIDVNSYLTSRTGKKVYEKFVTLKDLVLSSPPNYSSDKLDAFLTNNKDAYDGDSLTFVFKYTEKRLKDNGQGNPLQNPLRK